MSTFDRVKVKCGLCGHTFEAVELMSTNAFGSCDLDLRPPEMKRSTMPLWITKCPRCSYVHEKIEKPASRHARLVKSKEYKSCQGNFFHSPLAKDFYRYALILLNEKSILSAYDAFLHAAWCCDDFNDNEGASLCRRKAVALYDRRLFGKNSNLKLRHVDLLRRAGMFDEALEFIDTLELEEGLMQSIARFQKELSLIGDRCCYSVDDASAVFMKLLDEPFELIKSGKKEIEVRLYDEKRRLIKVGDKIVFSKKSSPSEIVRVRVVGLNTFKSFEELYRAYPSKLFGYEDKTPQELACEINKIYSQEDCEKYGALAIKIVRIYF